MGRATLLLLVSDVDGNPPGLRSLTAQLYGGDLVTRLRQELILGIGGVPMLDALGIRPGVLHLNEGHSAFAPVELARRWAAAQGIAFAAAHREVALRTVFTTHTPVAAGHDYFPPALVVEHLRWLVDETGMSPDDLLALGRVNGSSEEAFGLTPLALRMCHSTNGVSRKHGEVSRELWQKMWPGRSPNEVPITSITNGVHPGTWVAPAMRRLYEQHVGDDWIERARDAGVWAYGVERISGAELWQAHSLLKRRLVAFIRDHSCDARLARGESEDFIEAARSMFDPAALTIGFARRVAGYKRWDLLLSDPERLARLINDPERPIQFVFAGKAHPQDQNAKAVLQRLINRQRDSSVRHGIAFIEDYDQEVARQLVQSVDVWMNAPRRPLEASGTSGQKVAINGGLNVSVLDGWWLEGYDGDNGFAIGDLSELPEEEADRREADSLYRVLTEEIIPSYYSRDADGLPHQWVAMMKRSIQTLVPIFSSDRMVAEYAERIYS